jgi:hypothetical protein
LWKQIDITKYYLGIFSLFGHQKYLFAFVRTFIINVVFNKIFLFTTAGRRVGSGSIAKFTDPEHWFLLDLLISPFPKKCF